MFNFVIFFIFLIGLIMGSFLNCFIWRVHKKESLWNRSYCPKCRKGIHWYDNIPVLSFLLLNGKCRHCKKKISVQYPIVEFVMGLFFALAFYLNWQRLFPAAIFNEEYFYLLDNSYFVLSLARDWLIIFVSMAVLIYDWRWYIIPDIIILPAILIVSVVNIFLGVPVLELFWLMLIGGGFFLVQFLVSKGKWIGGGDVRLGAFMGVALGRLDLLILSLLLAYWLGSIVGIWLIIKKKKSWSSKVPLGIFLSSGTILGLFFGEVIIRWYFSLI